jgi:GR25 family glycosyltransferase involved in LPS biosynthesis
MQCILFINLDKRPDRLKHVVRQVMQSDLRDLSLVRLAAHNGSELTPPETAEMLTPAAQTELQNLQVTGKRQHHAQLTMGGIGCYLSHMDAWSHVASMDAKPDIPVLILEDDITLPRKCLDRMVEAWKYAKNKQALAGKAHLPLVLLYESFCMEGCAADARGMSQDAYYWGARAYAMTPQDAKNLLKLPWLPMDVQVDHQLQYFRDAGLVVIYVVQIVKQATHDIRVTDIQKPVKGRNAPHRRALVADV